MIQSLYPNKDDKEDKSEGIYIEKNKNIHVNQYVIHSFLFKFERLFSDRTVLYILEEAIESCFKKIWRLTTIDERICDISSISYRYQFKEEYYSS